MSTVPQAKAWKNRLLLLDNRHCPIHFYGNFTGSALRVWHVFLARSPRKWKDRGGIPSVPMAFLQCPLLRGISIMVHWGFLVLYPLHLCTCLCLSGQSRFNAPGAPWFPIDQLPQELLYSNCHDPQHHMEWPGMAPGCQCSFSRNPLNSLEFLSSFAGQVEIGGGQGVAVLSWCVYYRNLGMSPTKDKCHGNWQGISCWQLGPGANYSYVGIIHSPRNI